MSMLRVTSRPRTKRIVEALFDADQPSRSTPVKPTTWAAERAVRVDPAFFVDEPEAGNTETINQCLVGAD